eukprot:5156104-Pyramimonas_sp.AAC.1
MRTEPLSRVTLRTLGAMSQMRTRLMRQRQDAFQEAPAQHSTQRPHSGRPRRSSHPRPELGARTKEPGAGRPPRAFDRPPAAAVADGGIRSRLNDASAEPV